MNSDLVASNKLKLRHVVMKIENRQLNHQISLLVVRFRERKPRDNNTSEGLSISLLEHEYSSDAIW
jgi:hypothetical protein